MFCGKCGKEIGDVSYCPNCGSKVSHHTKSIKKEKRAETISKDAVLLTIEETKKIETFKLVVSILMISMVFIAIFMPIYQSSTYGMFSYFSEISTIYIQVRKNISKFDFSNFINVKDASNSLTMVIAIIVLFVITLVDAIAIFVKSIKGLSNLEASSKKYSDSIRQDRKKSIIDLSDFSGFDLVFMVILIFAEACIASGHAIVIRQMRPVEMGDFSNLSVFATLLPPILVAILIMKAIAKKFDKRIRETALARKKAIKMENIRIDEERKREAAMRKAEEENNYEYQI